MLGPPFNKSITPRTSLQCTMCACVLLPLLTCLRTPRQCTIDHSAPMTIWHRTTTPRHRLHAGQRLPQPEPPVSADRCAPDQSMGARLTGSCSGGLLPPAAPAARAPGRTTPPPARQATPAADRRCAQQPGRRRRQCCRRPAPPARGRRLRHGKRPALQSRGAGGARGRSCLPGLVGKDAPCSAPLEALIPTLALALVSTAVEAAPSSAPPGAPRPSAAAGAARASSCARPPPRRPLRHPVAPSGRPLAAAAPAACWAGPFARRALRG
jgi:hypothetical protein